VPFASIITPTRARPVSLERTLRSLQRQSFADWEAVVVDDGDGEGIVVASGLEDPRIAAYPSRGEGIVDARNTAVDLATGDLVCWLDDDDWWEDPHHLSLLRAEGGRPDRFYFRGGWMVFESDGGAEEAREVFDLDATCESLRENNTILNCSLAYRRELHDELGALDRELGGYCDWDFMLRMCDAGVLPHKLPGLGIAYAVHPSGTSAGVDYPERLRYFERFRDKHGLDVQIANHVLIHRMLG